MKIATWNLAGIKARMPVLLKWLEANSPDILVLQETKTVDEGFPRLELEAMGYNIATLGQKSWNGVAILSKRPFDEVHRGLPGDDSDEQARLIEAVFSVEGGVVRVCGIYLPNGNPVKTDKFDYKLSWMDRLHTFIEGRLKLEEPFIILGDFNIIPMPADATTPGTWVKDALFQPESRARWRSLINLGMVDAQRALERCRGLHVLRLQDVRLGPAGRHPDRPHLVFAAGGGPAAGCGRAYRDARLGQAERPCAGRGRVCVLACE